MTSRRHDEGLNQGGPSDQAGPRPHPHDAPGQGSQQGRAQRQEPNAADAAGSDLPAAPSHDDASQDARSVSETERQAGTPDPRATTDWTHGEGESPAARGQG